MFGPENIDDDTLLKLQDCDKAENDNRAMR